jgi:hypothetical protein
MPWRDKIRELERQHTAFVKENGTLKIRGRKKEGWSLNDTAHKLGLSVGKVSEDMRLAKGLKKYSEEFKKLKERRDAIAFMKIKGEW